MKKILFLLLPLILFADDIKFSSSALFDNETKKFATDACVAIEKELNIALVKNIQSEIYVDEAALYALKNGIIKFTIVRKKLFEEIGLDYSNMQNYDFEALFVNDNIVLLSKRRFMAGFSSVKKTNLKKQLKDIYTKLED